MFKHTVVLPLAIGCALLTANAQGQTRPAALGGSTSRAQSVNPQTTAAYLAAFGSHIQRLEHLAAGRMTHQEAAHTLRNVAHNMRTIPIQSVDRQAQALVWKTAAWIDRAANLADRVAAAESRSLGHGFAGGAAIAGGVVEEDPLLALIGIGIMLYGFYDADQETKAIQTLAASLEAEARQLDYEWQSYFRRFAVQARQAGLAD